MKIGVDVGGTFTDLVALDAGRLVVRKVPSTPPHFERAVVEAVEGVAIDRSHLIHGSTVATNALLERKLGRAALIMNKGFEDVLAIGRQSRPELYALHVVKPASVIPRELCFGIGGRLDCNGDEIEPLEEADVRRAVEVCRETGVTHVAICLLFSFANDVHERRVAQMVESAGLTASLSSVIAPEFREYERASTTAITASLQPKVEGYLSSLSKALPDSVKRLDILHGGGGTFTVDAACENAGRLLLSGPAGGAAGAAFLAKMAGFSDAIGLDVGGTSTDVTLITAGRPAAAFENDFDGLPVRLPMLDIHTVGAGGGSLIGLDAGGGLRVGPESAGADPGPACYGRGGRRPTVTDANLLLNRIPRDNVFGGIRLDVKAAEDALSSVAGKLNLSAVELAGGAVKLAEQAMALAILRNTAGRGRDPSKLPIVGFGGAGGLHACAVAEAVGSDTVILPPMAGVLSALGMVVAPNSADAARTVLSLDLAGKLDDNRIYSELGRLNASLIDDVPIDQVSAVESFADCRWRGQSHELTIRIHKPEREAIRVAFVDEYRRHFGDAKPPRSGEFEIVTLRLRRVGRTPSVELPTVKPVSQRGRLHAAGETCGPFVLVDDDCTAFIPAGWCATCDERGIVLCRRMT